MRDVIQLEASRKKLPILDDILLLEFAGSYSLLRKAENCIKDQEVQFWQWKFPILSGNVIQKGFTPFRGCVNHSS